jgi:hypothetical protein
VSTCTSRTALPRLVLLQVLVAIDVFRGDRVNLSKKYDYPQSRCGNDTPPEASTVRQEERGTKHAS